MKVSKDDLQGYITFLENRVIKLEKEFEQHKAVAEAVKFLVKVKRHKDTRTAWYLASQPIAWKKIEEALAGLEKKDG